LKKTAKTTRLNKPKENMLLK